MNDHVHGGFIGKRGPSRVGSQIPIKVELLVGGVYVDQAKITAGPDSARDFAFFEESYEIIIYEAAGSIPCG